MEDWKKYGIIGVVALAIVGLLLSSFLGYALYKQNQALEDANRVINAKIEELQEFDQELGIAKSELQRQSDLNEKYKEDIKAFQKEIAEKTDKIKAKDLKIRSRDRTIAALRRKIEGGKTTVTITGTNEDGSFEQVVDIKELCDGKTIAYEWQDNDARFHLKDPDISVQDNETFEYHQYIKIKGLVLADEKGNVQVKKVTAHEVLKKKNDQGEEIYEEIKDGELVLVDSTFEYTNNVKKERGLLDIFTLRPIATFDTSIKPGIGLEVVNLGKLIDYANVGLYGKLAVDATDPLGGSLQNSVVGGGVLYHIASPTIPTNFAVGVSVQTPFNNLGQWVLTADVILYLTDDLNPFEWMK